MGWDGMVVVHLFIGKLIFLLSTLDVVVFVVIGLAAFVVVAAAATTGGVDAVDRALKSSKRCWASVTVRFDSILLASSSFDDADADKLKLVEKIEPVYKIKTMFYQLYFFFFVIMFLNSSI